MIKNLEDYIENLTEIIHKYILIINTEISLDLKKEFIHLLITLLVDIFELYKEEDEIRFLENFYVQIPIKRSEYLAAALIYFILNSLKLLN